MPPTNFSDGGVADRTRRFHTASPASLTPARSPTRGSGLGACADIAAALADGPRGAAAVDCAHPAITENPASSSGAAWRPAIARAERETGISKAMMEVVLVEESCACGA